MRYQYLRPTGAAGLLCAALVLHAGGARAAAPTETLSPGQNHPSGTVTVGGTGFGDYEAVDLYFDTADEGLTTTGSTGAFSGAVIPVPASALPGNHWVTAIGRHSGIGVQKEFLVTTNWPKYAGGSHNQSTNLYENVLSPATVSGLDVLWTTDTVAEGYSSPAIYNSRLYVGSGNGTLYALNPTTGAVDWTATAGDNITSSPAAANGIVYVGSADDNVYAFNCSTGALVWKFATGNQIQDSSPAVVNNILYIGSLDGSLYALNATTGAKVWSYATGAPIQGSPAVANGIVYIAAGTGLFAIDAVEGYTHWSATLAHATEASPVVDSGVVYFGDDAGNLNAYNAHNGSLIWDVSTGSGAIYGGAVVSNGLVYVGNEAGTLSAFEAQSGALAWSFTTGGGIDTAPSIANGVLYVGSADYHLYAFDASYGGLLWSGATGGYVTSVPAVSNGMVYVQSQDFNTYAFAIGAGNQAHIKRPSIAELKALRRE